MRISDWSSDVCPSDLIADPRPRVVWNASASAPIGLYRIHTDHDPAIGALVAVTPPGHLARWLSARGSLPEGVPLLQHVAAQAGDRRRVRAGERECVRGKLGGRRVN